MPINFGGYKGLILYTIQGFDVLEQNLSKTREYKEIYKGTYLYFVILLKQIMGEH